MNTNGPFVQLDNLPLSDRIAVRLREAILRGELIPGQVLVESEIASQLGVSRAPVREAMRTLGTEGLVDTVAYHGTTVREITQTDVEELYSLRSVLEEFAIRQLITQPITDITPHLHALYTRMLEAAESSDLNEVSELDRSFHDALITLSKHQLLQHTWSSVSFRVRQVMSLRRIRRNITHRDDLKQLAESHLPIIEALGQANESLAVDLIRKHISTSGDLITADWESSF